MEEADGPSRVRAEEVSVSRPERSPRAPVSGALPRVRAAVPAPVLLALRRRGPAGGHTPRRDATVGQGGRTTSRRGTACSREPQKPWPWQLFSCTRRIVQPLVAADKHPGSRLGVAAELIRR